MDVVNVPTFDWAQAASTSIRMAERITGRTEVLVYSTVSPGRLAVIGNYCRPAMDGQTDKGLPANRARGFGGSGKQNLSPATAAVYFENPSYLGFLEDQGQAIADLTHQNGSILHCRRRSHLPGSVEPARPLRRRYCLR